MTDSAKPRRRQAQLADLIFGFRPAQFVHVMARLAIADLLGDRQMTVGELSFAAGAQPDMMGRLLPGLAGIGLVELAPGDCVSLTEMGGLLATKGPGSMRGMALYAGAESFRAWAELEHGVRTGEAPFKTARGQSFFDYYREHPAARAAFDATMSQLSRAVIREAVPACDFASASRVLDVAGGRGHFVAAVLDANPNVRGAVFDLPEACAEAQGFIAGKGLAGRSEVIGGSFFDSVPPGYDVHLLKWILHDWDDASCQKILQTLRTALAENGHLLVVGQLLPDAMTADGPLHPAVAMDLAMLVNFADARERTRAECDKLLTASGFAVRQVIELPGSGFSVLDCASQAS